MTGTTWYPLASKVQRRDGYGSSKDLTGITMATVSKIVLHSTETQGWPGYPDFAPTLTYDPWKHQFRQHMPLNRSASTLKDPSSTAVRENRDNVVQVEIVGYCDPGMWGKYGHNVEKMDDRALKELGEFIAWMHKQWQVPLDFAASWPSYPKGYGASAAQRMSGAEYDRFTGVLGHMHASGNLHGDPGHINIAKIADYARAAIAPAPPAPKPVPAPVPVPKPQPIPVPPPAPPPAPTQAVGSITAKQIDAAYARGLVNAHYLAEACDKTGLPFYLGCTIMQKETGGQNIYGHDVGGAMCGAGEVTEANYAEFHRLVFDQGQRSNGVGPMQLTWKGHFDAMDAAGVKPWLPADNIAYGVGVLHASLTTYLGKGLTPDRAFWSAAKDYNGNATYADDALIQSVKWQAVLSVPTPAPAPKPAPAPAPKPAPVVPPPPNDPGGILRNVVGNIPLGATLTGLTSLRWSLIQGMQPFDWQGETHWLVAQASHLDTLFHHYDANGKLRDTMRLVAGGHCSQFAARVVSGKLRVWTYDGLGNVYRIVYRPGSVTVKSADVTRAANLKGAVAARWDQNVIATRTVSGGKWTFRRYQTDDVVAKAQPVVQKWFRIPVTDVFQGFAVDAKHCHVLLGATSKPRRIVTYEWDGDQVAQKPLETRDITKLRVTNSTSTEPEGCFWYQGRLGVGIREGGLNPSRIIAGHLL